MCAATQPAVRAVDGVSFDIGAGDAVAMLGESGCGKTTSGRLLLKLDRADRGLDHLRRRADSPGWPATSLRDFRRQAQLVFQNPFDALNPRFTICRAVAEPLINAGIDKAEHVDRIARGAARARPSAATWSAISTSIRTSCRGGQLQRIVLARALILAPRFMVADEPVSMLDVSVRAGILNLMREVQRQPWASPRSTSRTISRWCAISASAPW